MSDSGTSTSPSTDRPGGKAFTYNATGLRLVGYIHNGELVEQEDGMCPTSATANSSTAPPPTPRAGWSIPWRFDPDQDKDDRTNVTSTAVPGSTSRDHLIGDSRLGDVKSDTIAWLACPCLGSAPGSSPIPLRAVAVAVPAGVIDVVRERQEAVRSERRSAQILEPVDPLLGGEVLRCFREQGPKRDPANHRLQAESPVLSTCTPALNTPRSARSSRVVHRGR